MRPHTFVGGGVEDIAGGDHALGDPGELYHLSGTLQGVFHTVGDGLVGIQLHCDFLIIQK